VVRRRLDSQQDVREINGMNAAYWRSIDNQTPVVVLYKGEKGALALARTLGRLGVPMYLVSARTSNAEQRTRYSMVEHSRYWRGVFFADFHQPRAAAVAFVVDVAKHIGRKPVLMTLSDWAAIFIEQHADELQQHYALSRGADHVIERLANKWDMFKLAQEHRVPTPLTVYPVTRAETEDFLKRISMPVVMKTADASLPYIPQKAILPSVEQALRKWDADAAKGPPNLILQEYIPGDATSVWMCNAYFTQESKCACVFTGRKLRQISDTGVATLAICAQNDEVAALTQRFMQELRYSGAVGVGYRYDARDGKYKLLDVNARLSGVFRLFSSPDGADTARVAYLDLTGQRVPKTALQAGRKWMLEDDLFSAHRAWKAGKLTVPQWIASMRGVSELHWLAADDMAPAVTWFKYSFVRPLRDKCKAAFRRLYTLAGLRLLKNS
jgi:D-aspartate ligase